MKKKIGIFLCWSAQWPLRSAAISISVFVFLSRSLHSFRWAVQLFDSPQQFISYAVQLDALEMNSNTRAIEHKQYQDNHIKVNWMNRRQRKKKTMKIDEIMTDSVNEWLLHNAAYNVEANVNRKLICVSWNIEIKCFWLRLLVLLLLRIHGNGNEYE